MRKKTGKPSSELNKCKSFFFIATSAIEVIDLFMVLKENNKDHVIGWFMFFFIFMIIDVLIELKVPHPLWRSCFEFFSNLICGVLSLLIIGLSKVESCWADDSTEECSDMHKVSLVLPVAMVVIHFSRFLWNWQQFCVSKHRENQNRKNLNHHTYSS